jgi:hypothetical protein
LVGRLREVAAVGELPGWDRVRLVALEDPREVGKPRLAIKVAATLAEKRTRPANASYLTASMAAARVWFSVSITRLR